MVADALKKGTLVMITFVLVLVGCQNEIHKLDTDTKVTLLNQPIYFGDVNSISFTDALVPKQNIHAKALKVKIHALKSYMGDNQERLSIKAWHDLDPNILLHQSDTINSTNSIFSFDGTHERQISRYEGRDYFWKTDLWFGFYGIADTVRQSSNQTIGHHGYSPSSVDNLYDNINWYKTSDSLVITIKRSGGYGRIDESIWLNTRTKTGKFYFWNKERSGNADVYYWFADGSGSYATEDRNGVVTPVAQW